MIVAAAGFGLDGTWQSAPFLWQPPNRTASLGGCRRLWIVFEASRKPIAAGRKVGGIEPK